MLHFTDGARLTDYGWCAWRRIMHAFYIGLAVDNRCS